jgi:hypothetical protein
MSSEPPSLDEMIFAISQVNFCSIYRETSPPPPSSSLLLADDGDSEDEEEAVEEKLEGSRPDAAEHVKPSKHLILLDLLALLLVTEPKSDVAVTMLVIHPAPIFYYSKNRPLTEDENRYVHKLFTLARHLTIIIFYYFARRCCYSYFVDGLGGLFPDLQPAHKSRGAK